MEVVLSALADAANTTDTGKLNVLGVFQTIYTSAVPARHPQMYLVLRFKASPGEKGHEHQLRFVLVDEDGTQVLSSPPYVVVVPIEDRSLNPEFNVIISLPNLPLPKFGRYIFDILVNNSSTKQVPLSVEPIPPPLETPNV
jgi:hypothetical protein